VLEAICTPLECGAISGWVVSRASVPILFLAIPLHTIYTRYCLNGPSIYSSIFHKAADSTNASDGLLQLTVVMLLRLVATQQLRQGIASPAFFIPVCVLFHVNNSFNTDSHVSILLY